MLTEARFSAALPRAVLADAPLADRPVTPPFGDVPVADVVPRGLSRAAAAHGVGAKAVDALIEELPVGVALADRVGRLVYANAAARALPLADVTALHWAVAHALLTGDEVRGERFEHHAPGHTRHWLSATVIPVRGANGHPNAALIALDDVTSLLQATEWKPIIDTLARL